MYLLFNTENIGIECKNNTFALKMINRRHVRFAWLLILVYLPMLVMVSFHHHNNKVEEYAVVSCCQDCLHHVHHSGHIASSQTLTHDCVLCQFQSTSYLVPIVAMLVTVAVVKRLTVLVHCPKVRLRNVSVRSTRAPPYCW